MMAFLDAARPYGHRSPWSPPRTRLRRSNPSQSAVNPPPSELESLPRPGDLIGGRFRITETLGQGGMGIVLGGHHLDLRQDVAIKVLRPSLANEPDALARFLREARAAASIKSRHAVRIYDVGTTDTGLPYMVMERLHGEGVDVLVERQKQLPVDQALQIIVEAANAIDEANGLGIVHRDVKPSNLFLADDVSGTPVVKVLDFGISKRVVVDDAGESASLTAPHTLLGSPQYMSPEQLRDPRSVDARTDVWGLGVTLFELLTGRVPFESESIPELCAHIFNSTPARAHALRPAVPPAISDIVDRCLAKRPEDRISSVAALVAELAPFCAGALAGTATTLARTSLAKHEEVRLREKALLRGGAPAASSRHRGPALVAAASASVAVGLALFFFRARAEQGGLESGADASFAANALAPAASSAATLAVGTRASNTTASSVARGPADAAVLDPAATAVRSLTSSPSPPAVARPRGLKGIKLLD